MSPKQGWFESDEDYRQRVTQEADEHTIENSTGSAPSRGWFENEENYRDRIAQEANERRIEDSTGDAPSRGWFENEDDYRERIAQEANERTIEDSTGSAPSKGWFESDSDYDVRVRREANEHIVQRGTDSPPKQGWFEGDHDYRSRIAHEAREVRASDISKSSASGISDSSSEHNTDYRSLSGLNSSSTYSYSQSVTCRKGNVKALSRTKSNISIAVFLLATAFFAYNYFQTLEVIKNAAQWLVTYSPAVEGFLKVVLSHHGGIDAYGGGFFGWLFGLLHVIFILIVGCLMYATYYMSPIILGYVAMLFTRAFLR